MHGCDSAYLRHFHQVLLTQAALGELVEGIGEHGAQLRSLPINHGDLRPPGEARLEKVEESFRNLHGILCVNLMKKLYIH